MAKAKKPSFKEIFKSRSAIAGRWMNQARDAMQSWVNSASGNSDRNRFLRAYNKQRGQQLGRGASLGAATKIAGASDEMVSARQMNTQNIGGMYLFIYKAEHREKLPYWDQYPLIFLLSNQVKLKDGKISNDHFMGLNLHYISPRQRALLMDAINDRVLRNAFDRKHERYDPNLYSKITYQVLKDAASHRQFKPCVKMYRKANVVSPNLIRIPGDEWHNIMFLDIARFQKKSQQYVHSESARNS